MCFKYTFPVFWANLCQITKVHNTNREVSSEVLSAHLCIVLGGVAIGSCSWIFNYVGTCMHGTIWTLIVVGN